MEYQNPQLIRQYQQRIQEIQEEIHNLSAKREVIKKTQIPPTSKELESLGLTSVKQKKLILDNRA